jgi:aminopeptidase N
MDNFYSATVYEKGAEIIRLYERVLGVSGFRKGMDLYFKRHDGSAVTCDDFWQAMHDANPDQPVGQQALHSLKKWYSQAGTPELTVTPSYNAENKLLTLACKQITPPTPGQPTKDPVLIPIAVGLVGTDGKDLPLTLNGVALPSTTAMLLFSEAEQSFVFTNVPSGAVPSILRDFSAPVRLTVVGQSDHDLTHLLAHDSDSFNRFEAGQVLARNTLLALYDAALAAGGSTKGLSVPSSLIGALKNVLTDTSLDGSFIARSISLPQEIELVDAIANRKGGLGADPVLVRSVRDLAVFAIAEALETELEAAIVRADAAIAEAEIASGGYSPDFKSVARRALKNKAIAYLSTLKKPSITASILARFKAAKNMTDQIASLAALVDHPGAERDEALSSFAEQFKDEPLVLLKWFSLQAMASGTKTTEIVKALKSHPSFVITTPNYCYSLFGAFSSSTESFHNIDGSGYKFLAEVVVELDAINPLVASRIVSAFAKLGQYDSARRALMRKDLENIAAHKGLSENVGEIVSRSLAASA